MINMFITNYKDILFNTAIIFSSVFELVLAYVLINGFFTPRFGKKRLDILAFAALGTVSIFFQNKGLQLFWKYAIEIAVLTVLLFLMYEGAVRAKVIAIAVFSLLIAVSEIGSSFLFVLMSSRFSIESPQSASYMQLGKLTLSNGIMILLSVITALFAKRTSVKAAASFKLWMALFSVPVISLITFSVYQFYIELYPVSDNIVIYIYASCGGLIFINVLVFVLFSRLQKQLVFKNDADMLTSQLSLQEKSINRLETLYNRTRSFRHDIKNHILLMNLLAEQEKYDELKKYLRDMSGVVDESDYVRISGISAVDAILNEKLYEAQSNDITTGYDVVNLDKNNIGPLDLCIILSNALDNAIEANLLIEDKTKRYIKLKIHGNGAFCVISVINPTDDEPKKLSTGGFVTRKSDTELHGFGLKSIENTVHKYHGEMLTKCDDGVFTLVIRLCCTR